ncbi:MAG TPA: ComF family protein [Candidatus Acidoferrales bacterium]|nr:ComF family protein [Candidatus Acidoferrales bacterium]
MKLIDLALRHCRLLFDVAVPVRCAACGVHGDQVCTSCRRSLAARPLLVRSEGGDIPRVSALGPHCGALRVAVLGLKYRNRLDAAVILGGILGRKLSMTYDCVVPVPLHDRRLAIRGYNQAEAIARGIARTSARDVVTDALVRVRPTHAQSSLALAERAENVANAFALGRTAVRLRDRRVLLVDDVVTTGATVGACAQALREAGIGALHVAALAIRL